MPYKPGESGNLAGRPKGSKDKIPAMVKAAVIGAFYSERVGGEEYLIKMALGDRFERASFSQLLGKCLPGELKIEADLAGPMQIFVITGIEGSPGSTKRKVETEDPKRLDV